MKKVFILFITIILLTGCIKNDETKYLYTSYIEELKSADTSTQTDIDISINVSKLDNGLLTYTALINKGNHTMKNIVAILIHDKESTNEFPSIGIYDEPISLDSSSEQKGIKLTGYIEEHQEITFKLLLEYTDEFDEEQKVYYIYNYRQDI